MVPPTNYGAFTKYGAFHHLWCLSPSMVHFPKCGALHQVWCFFTMYGDLLLKMKILTTIDLHACMWPGPSSDVSIRTVTQRFLSSGRSERKQRFPHSAQHGGEIGVSAQTTRCVGTCAADLRSDRLTKSRFQKGFWLRTSKLFLSANATGFRSPDQ